MSLVLVVLGSLAVLVGVLMASQATDGVALVGAGCFCGILARIAQASQQHKP